MLSLFYMNTKGTSVIISRQMFYNPDINKLNPLYNILVYCCFEMCTVSGLVVLTSSLNCAVQGNAVYFYENNMYNERLITIASVIVISYIVYKLYYL